VIIAVTGAEKKEKRPIADVATANAGQLARVYLT
jgi:hypothetical protein